MVLLSDLEFQTFCWCLNLGKIWFCLADVDRFTDKLALSWFIFAYK